MLRVTEIFRSIQGESTHAGRPCSFVRLTGCPMRCTWCDSEYTFTGGERISVEDVMRKVHDFGCQLVEVTGGEPLAQAESFDLRTQSRLRGTCAGNSDMRIGAHLRSSIDQHVYTLFLAQTVNG